MKKYDPFEEEFGEGNALDEGEFIDSYRGGSTNIRSGLRNRFNRNNFNQTRRDYNQLEERPTRPLPTAPKEPGEIEMSEIPEPKNLVEPELPAEAETEPLLPEEPELEEELEAEELAPVEEDFAVEALEPLEMESAEALETSVGASESIAEAFGVGGEVELTEMGIAGAEIAGEEAIAGGAGAIAGEEAGIFAGAGALAPETLGLSLVVGGIVGGLIAVFAPHQHKNVKFPTAGSVKLLTDKDKKEMIKNMNKDHTGKYDKTISQLNGYKGDYYLATTNEKDSDGHYKSVLVRRLTPNQLAKALITLQHDPNAYKGTDPAILEAMGLNPDLSKKQDPHRALNPNMLAEGVDFPDDDLIFKAMDDREKLLNQLTPMATYKQNLKKLDTLSGEDKEVFQKVLDAYAWDNNLNADGTAMSKTQIKNKGERPVIPAGETPESKKRQQEYQEYLADLETKNKDIKERNAQAQAEYQRKLNDYQAQKKSYDEALEQYHNDIEEYNKQLKNQVDTYNSQLKEDVIEYNTELGEYNVEEARATGIPIDAPVGQYTKINIQQVIDEKGEKYTPLPESPSA